MQYAFVTKFLPVEFEATLFNSLEQIPSYHNFVFESRNCLNYNIVSLVT